MSQKQRDEIAEFFKTRPNRWIPLPEILNLGIAQYNARIYDCRRAGMDIRNEWHTVDGVRHSSFMYVPNPIVVEPSGQLALAI